MIRLFAIVLFAAAFLTVSLKPEATGAAGQMVLVIARDWSTTAATVYRLERASPKEPWQAVGSPMKAILGRTGLAWDDAAGPAAKDQPVKKEGDGKSPAGIFQIGTIYGTVPANAPGVKNLRLPYQQITADLECVDDVKSAQYNRLVERSRIPSPDWSSSEKINSLTDSVYRWLAVIDYNHDGARRGAGSCIFLHVAAADGKPTSGCTALKEPDLLELFRWIDPRKSPVIVQTAADGLEALKRAQPGLLSKIAALPPGD